MTNEIEEHGWTAVPRDFNTLLKDRKEPSPLLVDDIPWPVEDLVTKVQKYAKDELREETYNHSMRVYYFARAIQEIQFPHHALSPRTLALTCLLHDIGTTHDNLRSTRMSFEFFGGMLALRLLRGEGYGASQSEAESVAETVFRHQDVGEEGKVSFLTGLVQLATLYDNMGGNAWIIHKATLEDVVGRFPRLGWSGCFSATINEENGLKPWAHTTTLGEVAFPEGVKNNSLMAPYE